MADRRATAGIGMEKAIAAPSPSFGMFGASRNRLVSPMENG
jgi:hypothetical protein